MHDTCVEVFSTTWFGVLTDHRYMQEIYVGVLLAWVTWAVLARTVHASVTFAVAFTIYRYVLVYAEYDFSRGSIALCLQVLMLVLFRAAGFTSSRRSARHCSTPRGLQPSRRFVLSVQFRWLVNAAIMIEMVTSIRRTRFDGGPFDYVGIESASAVMSLAWVRAVLAPRLVRRQIILALLASGIVTIVFAAVADATLNPWLAGPLRRKPPVTFTTQVQSIAFVTWLTWSRDIALANVMVLSPFVVALLLMRADGMRIRRVRSTSP